MPLSFHIFSNIVTTFKKIKYLTSILSKACELKYIVKRLTNKLVDTVGILKSWALPVTVLNQVDNPAIEL